MFTSINTVYCFFDWGMLAIYGQHNITAQIQVAWVYEGGNKAKVFTESSADGWLEVVRMYVEVCPHIIHSYCILQRCGHTVENAFPFTSAKVKHTINISLWLCWKNNKTKHNLLRSVYKCNVADWEERGIGGVARQWNLADSVFVINSQPTKHCLVLPL